MINLKTCSSLYDAEKIKGQYENTPRGDARATIIAGGRKLLAENRRRNLNTIAKKDSNFEECDTETSSLEYTKLAESTANALFRFAAKNACDIIGRPLPKYAKDIDGSIVSNQTFLATLADITSEIVAPMLPAVTSSFTGMLAQVYPGIERGKTKLITVKSNDIFQFDDAAYGAASNPPQRLYSNTVSLNPTLKTASATVNLFEYIANNVDLGDFFASIANGWLAYITGYTVKAFTEISKNADYFPSVLNQQTYSEQNFSIVANAVKKANGGMKTVCVGDNMALSRVYPDITTYGSFMSGSFGEEWAKIGYVSSFKGVPLYEINNPVVPGTQNTTISSVIPETELYFISIGAQKPIAIGMGADKMLTTITPDRTANESFIVNAGISADVKPIMGSKVGVIRNVK